VNPSLSAPVLASPAVRLANITACTYKF
jgi:hypothetical protein